MTNKPKQHYNFRLISAALLLATFLLALITCPHSKVEESFNLQATHDLYYHGLGPAWRSFVARGGLKSLVTSSLGVAETCVANDEGVDGDGTCGGDEEILPYDHVRFPGVVPRTFVGAFVLAYLAKFLTWVFPLDNPMFVQFLIRSILLLQSWNAHLRLSKALENYFGGDTTKMQTSKKAKSQSTNAATIPAYYLLITACQFHIPFYSSRLLPNTFALLLVTHAYAEWFLGRPRRTAVFLVFTTAIFRCDTLLLLFTVGLTLLIQRQLTVFEAIATGFITGIVSLTLTVPLDSLLWGRLVWPEFEVWWFNTVDNRSGEWGKMVWHWYFSKALPKGLLLTALLIPLAFVRLPECTNAWMMKRSKQQISKDSTTSNDGLFDFNLLPFFAPILGYICLYSFLPHKEIRFIFPALPMFNVCAAYGMSRLHNVAFEVGEGSYNATKSNNTKKEGASPNAMEPHWMIKFMWLCGLGCIAFTMIASHVFLRLSMKNYPGGEALIRLKRHLDSSIPLPTETSLHGKTKLQPSKWEEVRVHVDVASAMTGVSLFGQRYASHRHENEMPFVIEKSGYEEENQVEGGALRMNKFTHLLSEEQHMDGYHVVEAVKGFPRLDLRNMKIDTRNATYILEKDHWTTVISEIS